MAADTTQGPASITVDADNLYREESYTDLRAANIKCLTPVTADGAPDTSRKTEYIGDTTLMTQMGPIPVQFPLEADSLSEAFEKFPEGGTYLAVDQQNDVIQILKQFSALAGTWMLCPVESDLARISPDCSFINLYQG